MSSEPEDEPTVVRPFYDVTSHGLQVNVRAGFVTDDGEITELLVDITVGLSQAERAHAVAFQWYMDAQRALSQPDEEVEE